MSEDIKDEEMEESVVLLVDEDGKEHEFQLVDMLEVDGNQYAVLSPLDESGDESDEAVILKVALDSNGEEVLYDIEDDAEWEKAVEVWNSSLEEE